jgi:hypothetical protein
MSKNLESMVNSWIEEMGSEINIRNIVYQNTINNHFTYFSVMIWYDIIQPPIEVKQ